MYSNFSLDILSVALSLAGRTDKQLSADWEGGGATDYCIIYNSTKIIQYWIVNSETALHIMSAAPSNLTWNEWSSLFLDKSSPVIHGNGRCSVPDFWKGKGLVWSHYPESKPSMVVSGNRIVCDKDNDIVYSVGGVHTDPGVPNDSKFLQTCWFCTMCLLFKCMGGWHAQQVMLYYIVQHIVLHWLFLEWMINKQ